MSEKVTIFIVGTAKVPARFAEVVQAMSANATDGWQEFADRMVNGIIETAAEYDVDVDELIADVIQDAAADQQSGGAA